MAQDEETKQTADTQPEGSVNGAQPDVSASSDTTNHERIVEKSVSQKTVEIKPPPEQVKEAPSQEELNQEGQSQKGQSQEGQGSVKEEKNTPKSSSDTPSGTETQAATTKADSAKTTSKGDLTKAQNKAAHGRAELHVDLYASLNSPKVKDALKQLKEQLNKSIEDAGKQGAKTPDKLDPDNAKYTPATAAAINWVLDQHDEYKKLEKGKLLDTLNKHVDKGIEQARANAAIDAEHQRDQEIDKLLNSNEGLLDPDKEHLKEILKLGDRQKLDEAVSKIYQGNPNLDNDKAAQFASSLGRIQAKAARFKSDADVDVRGALSNELLSLTLINNFLHITTNPDLDYSLAAKAGPKKREIHPDPLLKNPQDRQKYAMIDAYKHGIRETLGFDYMVTTKQVAANLVKQAQELGIRSQTKAAQADQANTFAISGLSEAMAQGGLAPATADLEMVVMRFFPDIQDVLSNPLLTPIMASYISSGRVSIKNIDHKTITCEEALAMLKNAQEGDTFYKGLEKALNQIKVQMPRSDYIMNELLDIHRAQECNRVYGSLNDMERIKTHVQFTDDNGKITSELRDISKEQFALLDIANSYRGSFERCFGVTEKMAFELLDKGIKNASDQLIDRQDEIRQRLRTSLSKEMRLGQHNSGMDLETMVDQRMTALQGKFENLKETIKSGLKDGTISVATTIINDNDHGTSRKNGVHINYSAIRESYISREYPTLVAPTKSGQDKDKSKGNDKAPANNANGATKSENNSTANASNDGISGNSNNEVVDHNKRIATASAKNWMVLGG